MVSSPLSPYERFFESNGTIINNIGLIINGTNYQKNAATIDQIIATAVSAKNDTTPGADCSIYFYQDYSVNTLTLEQAKTLYDNRIPLVATCPENKLPVLVEGALEEYRYVTTDGVTYVEQQEKEAAVNGVEYVTLTKALQMANDGDTVTLLKDIIIDKTGLNVTDTTGAAYSIDKKIILDGQNHTITAQNFPKANSQDGALNVINVKAAETQIKDLTIDGKGTSRNGLNVVDCGKDAATVTISGVTSKNNLAAGLIVNNSQVQATNLTTDNNGWYGANVDKGGKLTLSGDSSMNEKLLNVRVEASNAPGELTIQSGSYLLTAQEENKASVIVAEGAKAIITGGTFSTNVQTYCDMGYIGDEEKNGVYEVHKHMASNFIHHLAEKSTCVKAGYEEYWECTVTGKLYSDEQRKTETDSERIKRPLAPHMLTKYERVEPTCVDPGREEYWHCTVCDKLFADEAATKETTAEALVIDPLGHDLKLVEGVDATTEKEGILAHYVCNRCGKWFWDKAATKEITNKNDVVIAKLPAGTEGVKDTVVVPDQPQFVENESAPEAAKEVAKELKVDEEAMAANGVEIAKEIQKNPENMEQAKTELKAALGSEYSESDTILLVVKPYL